MGKIVAKMRAGRLNLVIVELLQPSEIEKIVAPKNAVKQYD